MDTIDAIMLSRFRKNPERFRELDESEMVWPGDIVVDNGVAKYCDGPFHGGPTVKHMRGRGVFKRDFKYFREYPNG